MVKKTILFAFLSICFLQGATQNYPTKLTAVDKIYGLSKLWQEVNYNFAFFHQVHDLQFDSLYKAYIPSVIKSANDYEYYRMLKKFCATLNDGQTVVYFPEYINDSIDAPPIKIKSFGNKYFVVNTGKLLSEKLPVGSEIQRINGFASQDFFDSEVLPYISASTGHARREIAERTVLSGWKNTKVLLTYCTPGGEIKNGFFFRNTDDAQWVFPVKDDRKPVTLDWPEKNIALLTINTFKDENVIKEFNRNLRKLKGAKGIILDLRNNKGGSTMIAASILCSFTSDPFLVAAGYKTRNHIAAFKALGKHYVERNIPSEYNSYYNDDSWHLHPPDTLFCDKDREILDERLIVLVSPTTASAAEDFLIMLAGIYGRAQMVGETTFGSTGQPLVFDMPGGGRALVCTKRDYLPNGNDIAGTGIAPHHEVKPDIKDFLNGEDVVLNKALEMINVTVPEEK